MQKTRYVYSRPYVPKGTRRTEVLTTILDWETLQFEKSYHAIRCRRLCLCYVDYPFKNREGKMVNCTVGGNQHDVCAYFLSSSEISS